METSSVEKKFLYALLVIVILITLAIFYPFLTVFILAGAFAVILNPLCLWITKHITRNNQTIASIITIVLFLVLLCVPLFFAGTVIFNQAQNTYYSVVGSSDTGTFIQTITTTGGGFDSTVANSYINMSVNGGTSAAWTITLVQAELTNLN